MSINIDYFLGKCTTIKCDAIERILEKNNVEKYTSESILDNLYFEKYYDYYRDKLTSIYPSIYSV